MHIGTGQESSAGTAETDERLSLFETVPLCPEARIQGPNQTEGYYSVNGVLTKGIAENRLFGVPRMAKAGRQTQAAINEKESRKTSNGHVAV